MAPHHVTPRTKKVLTQIQEPSGEPVCRSCQHEERKHRDGRLCVMMGCPCRQYLPPKEA